MKRLQKLLIICVLFAVLYFPTANAQASAVTPPVCTTGSEDTTAFPSYPATIPAGQPNYVVPVIVGGPGTIYVNAEGTAISESYVQVTLYSDAALTSQVDYFYLLPTDVVTEPFNVSKAGTYYMEFSYSDGTAEIPGVVTYKPYFVSRANRTLVVGGWVASAERDSDYNTYYQINVSESGYIAMEQANPTEASLSLAVCGSDKSLISRNYSLYIGEKVYYPVEKGTYYIKTNGTLSTWYKLRYTYQKSINMSSGKSKVLNIVDDKCTFYLKLKADKTGLLNLYYNGSYGADVTLCNSKKKSLSDAEWMSDTNKKTVFAVKKGNTYYLKIKDTLGGIISYQYTISASAVGKNKAKAKATVLKSNKTDKGTILSADKTSYWYKFSLKSAKKVKIYAKSSSSSGKIMYKVYNKKGEVLATNYGSGIGDSDIISFYSKLSKGTYYVKVCRYNALSSGIFSVKVKY